MKTEIFKIQIAKEIKINAIGAKLKSFSGLLFGLSFFLYLPFKLLTWDVSPMFIRIVFLTLIISPLFILLGLWLNSRRTYTKAELQLYNDRILLISNSKEIEINHNKIKKIYGVTYLPDIFNKLNFILEIESKEKYEIRANKNVFLTLIEFSPKKV